jgi:hypothetical protein
MTTTNTEALELLRLLQSLYECDLKETSPEWAQRLRDVIARLEATPAPTQPDVQGLPEQMTDDEILTDAARHLGETHVENCGLGDIKDFARAVESRVRQAIAQATQPDAQGLPPLKPEDHPDNQVMQWSKSEIRAINARVAQAVALATKEVHGWVPVTERLPERCVEVLVAFAGQISLASTGQYTGNGRAAGGWCYPQENLNSRDDGTDPIVTHWMPLPEVPTMQPTLSGYIAHPESVPPNLDWGDHSEQHLGMVDGSKASD